MFCWCAWKVFNIGFVWGQFVCIDCMFITHTSPRARTGVIITSHRTNSQFIPKCRQMMTLQFLFSTKIENEISKKSHNYKCLIKSMMTVALTRIMWEKSKKLLFKLTEYRVIGVNCLLKKWKCLLYILNQLLS